MAMADGSQQALQWRKGGVYDASPPLSHSQYPSPHTGGQSAGHNAAVSPRTSSQKQSPHTGGQSWGHDRGVSVLTQMPSPQIAGQSLGQLKYDSLQAPPGLGNVGLSNMRQTKRCQRKHNSWARSKTSLQSAKHCSTSTVQPSTHKLKRKAPTSVARTRHCCCRTAVGWAGCALGTLGPARLSARCSHCPGRLCTMFPPSESSGTARPSSVCHWY
jgi:hypothetical protein